MMIRGREYSDYEEYIDEVQEYRLEEMRERSYLRRWPDDNEEEEEVEKSD